MYTQSSIDNVKEADIVQVISSFVDLKKEGANFKAKSPFVDEKTASFVVSPSKQIFKCFSSQIGGDGIKFVQEYLKVNFIEAIKIIAEKCGIFVEQEKMSDELKAKVTRNTALKEFNRSVANKYAKELHKLKPDHWANKLLKERGYTQDTIIEFQLGFAPGKLVNKASIEHGKLELAREAGLCNTKDGTSYDCFTQRLVFPIHNVNGQVLGFGGRRSNAKDQEGYAKYINSKETSIYNKSNELYGLYQSKQQIAKQNQAVLVEGYTDVISLHQSGCATAVATCGTALTPFHAKKLAKYCSHVIIFRDGDEAGKKASMNDIDALLNHNLQVSICLAEDGEDPDSMSRSQIDINTYIKENHHDALIWKVEQFYKEAGDSIAAKANVLSKIIKTLAVIKDGVLQKAYCKALANSFKQLGQRELEKGVKEYIEARAKKALKESAKSSDEKEGVLGLPKGADQEQFLKDGFAEVGNCYYFRSNEGFFKGTDHIIRSLFHIYGKSDNKRLCEVINQRGQRRLIDFDSKDFINFNRIQERLIEEGVFLWMPQTSNLHFKMVTQKILREFILAYELKTLGWQQEQFYAFSNGVYHNNNFQEVNKYGIIQLETEKKEGYDEQSEIDNIKHYYSPAFSEIYKNSREDDDPYENDRSFIYKQSPVSFDTWMKQMQVVYKSKGYIAIAFVIATCFRDFILSRYSFFPHLFLTGEKGSGKSKFGDSISNFFTYKLAPFDLNSGTKVGFYRRLARIKNAPVFFEEFHDGIELAMFQSLKGAYDGRGREKGNMTTDNRTSISKVNSSCIIAGQYISSRDDNSLTSRSIIEHFIKPLKQFSAEQVREYDLLKKWEEEGLSSMVLDIVKYRSLFEQNFHATFSKNNQRFKKDLKNYEYQERMLSNYNALYTPLEILYSNFNFPFKLEEFYEQCKLGIIDNSDLIIESEGIAKFWEVLEHLLKIGKLRDGVEFIIEKPRDVKINPAKGVTETYANPSLKPLLFLRLSAVHQEYHLEASKRKDMDVIGPHTLVNYFKSKRYFISSVSKKRFNSSPTSCYLFDYQMMRDKNILNLDKEDYDGSAQGSKPATPNSTSQTADESGSREGDQEPLPF